MGEPAIPTPEQRAATRALARFYVDTVRNDDPFPAHDDDDMFRLAQEVELLTAEIDNLTRLANAAPRSGT